MKSSFLSLKSKMLLFMLLLVSIGIYALTPTRIYFTNLTNPPAAPATQTNSSGSFSTSALSGWTGYSSSTLPAYFSSGGSSGYVQLNFATPLNLLPCGSASSGSIVVTWGHTSAGKVCNISLNGGSAVLVGTATVAKAVHVDTYQIPAGTTNISSLKLISSGNSGLTVFSVEILTCVDQPTLVSSASTLSGFTYAQGLGPSANKSFTLSGTTLTPGDLTVQAPANYEVSLSATTGFASSLTIPVATASLSSTTVYARLIGGLSQSSTPYSGNITISGCDATVQTVSVTGTVTAPTIPTLIPSPQTLTGLNYAIGAGPSASQIFNVSAALLDGTAVTARVVSPNFEVSLSPNSGYAQSVTVTSAAGTLASTPVYVRLKSGISTISPYSDLFYLEGGGASTHKLNITGAVIPTPLLSPVVGIPTAATEDGFTANWTTVPNATGYIVNVYNSTGSSLVKSVNVAAQTSNSSIINGLAGSTDYTYKVVAVGNGTTSSNSAESSLSSVITTLVAATLITPPCAITQYESEFTDWDDVVSSSGDALPIGGGAGAGFSILKAEVKPTTSVAGNLGVFNLTSSGGFTTKPIEFLGGGNVIVEVVASGNKKLTLTEKNSGAAGIIGTYVVQAMPAATISGNVATLVSGTGIYKINFALAAGTFTGTKTLSLMSDGGGVSILNVTICSGAGVNPVLTTYPMPNVTRTLSATVGGNTASTVVQLYGYNLTADAVLSIEGPDKGYFSLPVSTVAAASAANGKNVGVVYKSSVLPSIHSAKLKVESPGATPIYVPLYGISTPTATTPKILADTSTIAFWTSLVENQVRTLNLAGVNLTGNVTMSITGSGANNFTLNKSSISASEAAGGSSVDITYIADTKVSSVNAVLEIKSTGAPTVYIPLMASTSAQRPELYELKFEVAPAGSAVLTVSPTGTTQYPKGTVVNVLVTPETGYAISYWSDAAGNKSSKRSFTVSSKKNGTIIVNLVKLGCTNCNPITATTYVAYTPNETANEVSSNAFMARWAPLKDADELSNPVVKYEVVLYNEQGTEISRFNAGTSTNYSVTGLTAGVFYKYAVVATKQDATTKTTPNVGSIQTTPPPAVFSCGN